jgi:hypothetical protein
MLRDANHAQQLFKVPNSLRMEINKRAACSSSDQPSAFELKSYKQFKKENI